MDHTVAKLDECIFDYLASHANQMKSMDDIWGDITSSKGHRCSQLASQPNRTRLFIAKCYSMDRDYKNVRKLFRGNKLYLIFDTDNRYETYDESIFKDVPLNPSIWDIDAGHAVDYLFDGTDIDDYAGPYMTNKFNGQETILHILVRRNDVERLKQLLKHPNIEIDCKNMNGQTPYDLAQNLGFSTIASMLTNYKYDAVIRKLEADLNKERTLRTEYQKTIDMTGRHMDLMNKLEAKPAPTQKIVYLDTPLSDFSRYSLYIGYLAEIWTLLYFVRLISGLFA